MRDPRGNDGEQAPAVVILVHAGEESVEILHRSLRGGRQRGYVKVKMEDKWRKSGETEDESVARATSAICREKSHSSSSRKARRTRKSNVPRHEDWEPALVLAPPPAEKVSIGCCPSHIRPLYPRSKRQRP